MKTIRGERVRIEHSGNWMIYATPFDNGEVLIEASLNGKTGDSWRGRIPPKGKGRPPSKTLKDAIQAARNFVSTQNQGEDLANKMLRDELERLRMEG